LIITGLSWQSLIPFICHKKLTVLRASPNGFLFKSEKMRDEFNRQLRWLKSTGQYQKIFARYARYM